MSLASPVLSHPPLAGLPYIEADLHYLTPMAAKPVTYMYDPPSGVPRQSGSYQSHRLPIHNARAIASHLSVEKGGFALANRPSAVQDFYDEDEIRRVYYPEAAQLLLELTDATHVIVFDHNLRNADRMRQGEQAIKEPVKRVHNDFTAQSGYSRAYIELTKRGLTNIDELLQRRFSIINLWRPIAAPVLESPLAICNAQSIASTDYVATDLVYRDRIGETYAFLYNTTHQWFYFPQMQPDEALLIKCFDSAQDGRARFTPHTAFDDPTSPREAPARESIELRILVFYTDSIAQTV